MQWSDALLDEARRQGDDLVDRLAAQVLEADQPGHHVGRQGYNHLLDVADKLIEAPELMLVEGSHVRKDLEQLPPALRDYFDPMPVPDWVEPERIAQACRIWRENMISVLGVLYAASLPQCYLMKRGIPVLYATGRLLEPEYISQRMYETGLMLDSVLTEGGLKILTDLPPHNASAPRVRYVWGEGYVAAKKVRFLHASMRFLLLHPDQFRALTDDPRPRNLADGFRRQQEAWPVDCNGLPVNQEDLAYTLLTFGYTIPLGLRRYGVPLRDEDCEDFLHAWRLVGSILGIRDDLLPRDVPAAGTLFDAIHRRQAAHTESGVQMTASLIRFLSDYLPDVPFVKTGLPAALIVHQLGDDATLILTKDDLRAARSPLLRLAFASARGVFRVYFLLRRTIFQYSPTVRALVGGSFHDAGVEIIHSWRGAWRRDPFDVPEGTQHWERQRRVDPEYLAQQRHWRRRIFRTVFWAAGCFVVSVLALALTVVVWLFNRSASVPWILGASLITFLFSVFSFKSHLPRVIRARPKPASGKT